MLAKRRTGGASFLIPTSLFAEGKSEFGGFELMTEHITVCTPRKHSVVEILSPELLPGSLVS